MAHKAMVAILYQQQIMRYFDGTISTQIYNGGSATDIMAVHGMACLTL